MRLTDLIEARRNPEQNPKINPWDVVQELTKKAEFVPNTRVKNVFVSFTDISKLGINPKSQYETPLGIYAYPGKYVVSIASSSMDELPFAGEAPFVNIFKARGDLVDLSTMPNDEVIRYYRAISKVVSDQLAKSNIAWKTAVDQVEKFINDASSKAIIPHKPGGRFWYVTRAVAREILADEWGVSGPVAWNKLFRLIGIDGCVDSEGHGIIHTSEPTQAVFFSIRGITENQRLDNRYSAKSQARGEHRKDLHIGNIALVAKAREEGTLLDLLSQRPKLIAYVKNPSPEMILTSLNSYKSTVILLDVKGNLPDAVIEPCLNDYGPRGVRTIITLIGQHRVSARGIDLLLDYMPGAFTRFESTSQLANIPYSLIKYSFDRDLVQAAANYEFSYVNVDITHRLLMDFGWDFLLNTNTSKAMNRPVTEALLTLYRNRAASPNKLTAEFRKKFSDINDNEWAFIVSFLTRHPGPT